MNQRHNPRSSQNRIRTLTRTSAQANALAERSTNVQVFDDIWEMPQDKRQVLVSARPSYPLSSLIEPVEMFKRQDAVFNLSLDNMGISTQILRLRVDRLT